MLVDDRQVLGASTWLKPAKFAISMALTSATLAVLLRQLAPLGRGGRWAVGLFVGMMSLELAIITVQAARGVPSHFNASTPLNGTLFTIMGAAIVVVTVALGYLGWRSFRQPLASFRTPAVGLGRAHGPLRHAGGRVAGRADARTDRRAAAPPAGR